MGVEFRQRSASDFAQMLNRRKWHIILPALAFFIASVWVVKDLPKMYESRTYLIIMPPTISEKVAPSLTDIELSKRIQAMRQDVLSRSSLQALIEKYNLYESERAAGEPLDWVTGKMIGRISIEIEKSDDKREVLGFEIRFKDPSPEAAQAVTAALAERYVSLQNVESTESAETTRKFIDEQMAQAKSRLDALEKQRLGIMVQNVNTLPESSQGLIAQLQGLRQREETISKEKESLVMEKGRIQDSIRAMNSQGRLIENFGEKETQDAAAQASRIEDTPAYAGLVQRRAELNSRLSNLKKQYREKHPEIVQVQTDIDKLNEELERLSKNTDQRVKLASQSSQRKADMQKKSLDIEKEKAEGQIAQIEKQLEARDAEVRHNAGQIGELEAKINTIPNVKVALEGVDNQYQSAKANYDELSKKYNNAQQQVQLESNAQGETIRVVDPASLPFEPLKSVSKQLFYVLIGTAAGIALGLLLAGSFEVPRLFRIQSIDDAAFYTGLPVLASVPPLLTDGEVASIRRVHRMKVLSGGVAALAVIPLLVMVLHLSRVFER
jgi:polysaccharide biosynthesis transport protein